jgi:hypothetical protein
MSEWSDVEAGRAIAVVILALGATVGAMLTLVLTYALTWGYAIVLP